MHVCYPLLLTLAASLAPALASSAPPPEAPGQAQRQWEPCGTRAERLADIYPGPRSSNPMELVHGDGVLFFTAEDGMHGRELWKSSGTGGPGTFLVKDIRPGGKGSDPHSLTVVGELLFFIADDGVHGRELWVSDGTAAGTHMVENIRRSSASDFPFGRMFAFEGVLYFALYKKDHRLELWRSDGTAEGTFLVEDLGPGPFDYGPYNFLRVGDGFYFQMTHPHHVFQLRRSTGAPGSVLLLERFSDIYIVSRTRVKSSLFFVTSGPWSSCLWKTDGTPASTLGLRCFSRDDGGSGPSWLVALGNRLFFSAGADGGIGAGYGGGPEGEELWVSDGTKAGTTLLKDIRPGPGSSAPRGLAALGSRVFFSADDGSGVGRELWVTDGTSAGTVLFKDLEPGAGSSSPQPLTAIYGTLFFSVDTAGRGRELWVTDGTEAGTRPLDELAPGPASSWWPYGFIRSGWDVFFTAYDASTGIELWAVPFRPDGACAELRR